VSSPLVAVTIAGREGARVRMRCRDLHDPSSLSVTRSFIVLVFTIGSPAGDTTPGLCRAAARNGLVEPPSADEAAPAFAPWIDTVIRTTRVVSRSPPLASTHEEIVDLLRERAGDPALTWESLHTLPPRRREDLLADVSGHYVLEVEFANEELASEIRVGWVFDTYAYDAWWQDPTNPLATDTERAAWSAAAVAFRSAREDAARRVSTWLAAAEEKRWLELRAGGRGRLLEAMLETQRAARDDDEPAEDATESLVELLMDHADVEEIYASDDELRASLLTVVGP
jgi:hypothetical protein